VSDAGTRIMAAGLVDEGVQFEAMEAKIAELTALLESKTPVCPHCKTAMKATNFTGYYDKFSYWECACDRFENGAEECGAYV